METQTSSLTSNGKGLLKAILIAALTVGILDGLAAITSAYLTREITPAQVFRYVASGVFGLDAIAGGTVMAFLGLLFHFTVASGWTTLFFLLYTKLKFLSRNKYIAGVGYVIFILVEMNMIVVPLSNVPNAKPGNFHLPQLFIHMFIIGLPISLLANRYFSSQRQ